MKEKNKSVKGRYGVNIDPEVMTAFKHLCVDRLKTVSGLVEELIKKELQISKKESSSSSES